MNYFLSLPFWLSPLFLQEGDSRQQYGADLPAGVKPWQEIEFMTKICMYFCLCFMSALWYKGRQKVTLDRRVKTTAVEWLL